MQDMPGMNHADSEPHAGPENPASMAQRANGAHESEFNHRLAGFFLLMASVFMLAAKGLAKGSRFAYYLWPCCFLATGLFLLIYSDAEVWPRGPQSPWYAMVHNLEALQHKLFAVILLVIGLVELQRVRERLKAAWAGWLFPALALAGSILILFHAHGGDMSAPHAMETMRHIQTQHTRFAAVGVGIAVTSGLAETEQKWRHVFRVAWPALLAVLGILLIFYTE